MANITLTDINDATVYIVNKQNINAIFEQTEFRRVLLYDGTEYDVAETFEALNTDIGGQPITGP